MGRGGGPTGLYVAEHAADASYQIWYWRKGSAASTIAPADVDRVDLDGVRMVHLSGISQAISASSRAATRRLAQRARERDILVSLDINFRPQLWSGEDAAAAMHEVLPDANLVFCGAPDESLAVAGLPDPEDAARYFLDRGAEVVAVTMAENGALAADGNEVVRLPHVARRIQGPQGAGDAFVGGFLAGRLSGAGLATCARFGTLVAGLKVEKPGPLHGLPQRPEIVARAAELGWDDVLANIGRFGNRFRRIGRRTERIGGDGMIVVTTLEISGREITETLGIVQGNSVRARGIGRDLMAGLRTIKGGEVREYAELLAQGPARGGGAHGRSRRVAGRRRDRGRALQRGGRDAGCGRAAGLRHRRPH